MRDIPQILKNPSKNSGIPKSVEERRARFLEWMGHPSLTSPPHASDDDAGDDEGSEMEDVGGHFGNIVAALLDLGSGEGGSGVGGSDDDGEAEC